MNLKLPRGSAPIYQRLAGAIKRQIERNVLKPGQKLPTVRALSEQLHIASGTIRHAYNLLVDEGWLVMVQGRGTFVREGSATRSREVIAMAAIDKLLGELTEMRFTPREIDMYFQLKLSAFSPGIPLTQIALIECNAETLSEMTGQLAALPGIELTEYLLEDVRAASAEVFSRYEIIITTQTHYHELCTLFPGHAERIARVVLAPRPMSTISIARIDPGSNIGIFCRSQRFYELVASAVRQCPHLRACVPTQFADMDTDLAAFTKDLDVLLVAPDYLSLTDEPGRDALQKFADAGSQIIPYHHQIDQGSYMHIEDLLRNR